MLLTDFFTGSSFSVELEIDLSIRQQLLDVAVIRKKEGAPPSELPDGLDDLAVHNLITYKSLRQSLDEWALDELLAHYVNYRKQVNPSSENLPGKSEFRLYAVSTRVPTKLMQSYPFEPVMSGVYNIQWGSMKIRVIVPSEVANESRNAVWQLFSAVPEKVKSGASRYRWHRNDLSTMLNDLFTIYNIDGVAMPYTVEDYKKEATERFLKSLSPEDILKSIPPEDFLKILPPKERLKGLLPKERLEGLPPKDRLEGLLPKDRLEGLPPKDRLEGLPPKDILKTIFPDMSAKEIEELLKKKKP